MALAAAKRAVLDGLALPLNAGLQREAELVGPLLMGSESHRPHDPRHRALCQHARRRGGRAVTADAPRLVVVTGGHSGLGLACADAFRASATRLSSWTSRIRTGRWTWATRPRSRQPSPNWCVLRTCS